MGGPEEKVKRRQPYNTKPPKTNASFNFNIAKSVLFVILYGGRTTSKKILLSK